MGGALQLMGIMQSQQNHLDVFGKASGLLQKIPASLQVFMCYISVYACMHDTSQSEELGLVDPYRSWLSMIEVCRKRR